MGASFFTCFILINTSNFNLSERHAILRDAETKAAALFEEVEKRQPIRAGITEKALNTEIYQLALELYGIKKYWHKRIVRAGPNTISPYRENPPDLLIKDDDIIFLDFRPVFEDWEADYGRTFVLGADPNKLRIQQEIEDAWHIAKAHFDKTLNITGAELYRFVIELTTARGWEYPQAHCGHLVGNFPHEKLQEDELHNYIHRDNHLRMRDPDTNGEPRDWILEIHFVDRALSFGGLIEQLLTVD